MGRCHPDAEERATDRLKETLKKDGEKRAAPREVQTTMSRKDEELKSAKGKADRVSEKDVKQAVRVNQASSKIGQPGQEIADDEVTIAKTGSKP
jgi:hypothetical protein